jgi:hypothetical protein
MFELQYTIQFLKAASADFRFGNGEVFQSEDGTLVSHTKSHVGSIAAPAVLNRFSLIWFSRATLQGNLLVSLPVFLHGTFLLFLQ